MNTYPIMGYTVAYDQFDGTVGFLGSDDGPCGSGYTIFSNRPSNRHIYSTAGGAAESMRELGHMTNYHGYNKIKSDTIRVVALTLVPVESTAIEQSRRSLALAKLTDEDRRLLGLNDISGE